MSDGIYYDTGSFSNLAAGIVRNISTAYPFSWPNNGLKKETTVTFEQLTASVTDPAFGAACTIAAGVPGVLSAKSEETIGAGVSRLAWTYTEVPANWTTKQIVAYTFPGLSGGIGANWSPYFYRAAVSLYCVANVSHQFTNGAAPTPAQPFIVTDNGNVADYIGTSNPNFTSVLTDPSIEPASYVITGSIELVRPTIWDNVLILVNKPI